MNKIDKFIEENINKNTLVYVLKYLGVAFLINFALMIIYRPDTFFDGSYIQYLQLAYKLGYLYEPFVYLCLWTPPLALLLYLFRGKIYGLFFLAWFSFWVGTEMYYFQLQGGHTAWNIGVNQLAVENIVKAFQNLGLLFEASTQYSHNPIFTKYMVLYPIGIFVSILLIIKLFKLPRGKYNIWALPVFLFLLTFGTEISVPYFLRVAYEFETYGLNKAKAIVFNIQRKPIHIKEHKDSKIKNIIFIMDESERGDFMSVNSNDPEIKKATPFIEKLLKNDKFKTFGVMYPLGNCSYSSNAMFMTGGKIHYAIEPTIFQYMKNAGYQTIRLDAPHTGYQNGVQRYDKKYIDKYMSEEKVNPKTKRDFACINDIGKILSEPGKHFIYFTKQGSHFPVTDSYPKDKELFNVEKVKKYSPEWYKKQYLNAIHWNVNEEWKYLVNKIIKDRKDTVVVWQSDHGIDMAPDKNKKYILLTHCETGFNHYKAMYNAAGGIFSNNKNLINKFKNLNQSSGKQTFSTLLYLAGYSKNNIEKKYWPPFVEPIKDYKSYPVYSMSEEKFIKIGDINKTITNFKDLTYGINKRKVPKIY